ncbi:MAG: FtsQ-type POTRA domain-containing protein [Ilumatobacteraceae bacterium]|jgi:cell division protein FtsQ|nr:FtsQ-type POTRA domain-containing protein [Ilumatobacteraceae bacterium]
MEPPSMRSTEPDPAALDELLRAFAVEADEPEADADPDVDPDAELPAALTAPSVVRIEDDGVPDAVYLDEAGEAVELAPVDTSTGEASGGSVVVITDDETGDAVVPNPPGAVGRRIEPRIRERRIEVRRSAGRRRLVWVLVAAAVLAVVVGALAVVGSPLFDVEADDVEVTGVAYTDRARLQAVIDDLVGTPVLLVDRRAVQEDLEAIPWVESARVTTRLPHSATIEIRERRPLATFQGPDGRFRVIDRDGRVLDVIEGQPIAYVVLTGPDHGDLPAGAFAPPPYAAAAELVQALTGSVRGRVVSIEVTADGTSLTMQLDDGVEVRFGAATDLLAKLVRLETALPIATERGATVIDVSTSEVTIR